jgi:hypothetical protein
MRLLRRKTHRSTRDRAEQRQIEHEQHKLRKEGRWPPPNARDLQAREFARGNWRPLV